MNIYDHIEYAGFAMIESGNDMYLIREKADDQYEIFLGSTLLGTCSTVKESIDKVYLGIKKMAKLKEATGPTMPAESWVQTDDGLDFVAELIYMAEGGEVQRYDIGMLLREYGILANADYINYFISLLANADYKVI